MKTYKGFRLNLTLTFLATSFLLLQACGGGGGGDGGNTGTAKPKVYMSATDGVKGYELYASDGTTGGTALIKDINSTGSSNPRKLVEMNGIVYFCANDGVNTSSLWKTDGTTGGTVLVNSVNACTGSSPPVVIGNAFYFAGGTSSSGIELWKSDGTTAGTIIVKDINPGTVSSSPWGFVAMDGNLYFGAANASNSALWKSDGTTDGTVLVNDISPGFNIIAMNQNIYFTAYTPSYGYEIWKSDGTTAGTNILIDLNTNRWLCDNSPLGSNPAMLTRVGDKFYFTANNNPNNTCILVFNGPQVWVSDGTTTTKLIELAPPSTGGGSYPRNLTAVGNTLFFTGYTSATGTELWKSDGTVAGTVMVKDIDSGTGSGIYYTGYASLFTEVNNSLYFSATDGTGGLELWKSDGSALNTVLVRDINTTTVTASSDISRGITTPFYIPQYKIIGTTVYFTANDGINGLELWRSDGTNGGTNIVADINIGNSNGVDSIFN